jgi:uncharacterized membrane protein YedE/YeeE
MDVLHQNWPWYVSGPLLGLMVPILLLLGNKQFGVSANFRHLCAMVAPKSIPFFNYDWKSESWNLVLITGTVLGAYIANEYAYANIIVSEDTVVAMLNVGITHTGKLSPTEIFSFESLFTLRGFIFIVVGGFLVGFGTRYANGCTSGHAIMGLSMLNVNSLIAVIGFFVGGLLMSWLLLPYLFTL